MWGIPRMSTLAIQGHMRPAASLTPHPGTRHQFLVPRCVRPQVCPVAIKYNKIFVDAFWNSRRESFGKHLFRLLTSWALVCDIYFLEPQALREGACGREGDGEEEGKEVGRRRKGRRGETWGGGGGEEEGQDEGEGGKG